MRVGVLGGGQLARMLALAGHPLGIRCVALDPAADACAGQVAPLLVAAYDDQDALARLARESDVVTYEFENVPSAAVEALVAAHAEVHPGPAALAAAQDRLVEKRLLRELGVATAPFAPVDDAESLERALRDVGLPALLKTRRLGYDGKGQRRVDDPGGAERARQELGGGGLLLEGLVDFRRELSVIAVRGRDGATRCYPLVENRHHEGILRVSLAPAPGLPPDRQAAGEAIARAVADRLGYVGVLAVELFDTDAGLLANELAPRVHNSGHWTIEGAVTSQFESHLRAVLGLPAGDVAPVGHAGMVNVIGDVPPLDRLLAIPGAHVHLYGKAPRPGRKLGHVTVVASDPAERDAVVAAVSAAAVPAEPRPRPAASATA